MTKCRVCCREVDINTDHVIECDTCTMKGVAHVRALERAVGMDIKDTNYYKMALKRYIHNERAPKLAGRLENLRKKKGWSIKTLADILGISKQYANNMLKGQKALNIKALELIGIKIYKKRKATLLRSYFWDTFGVENKNTSL